MVFQQPVKSMADQKKSAIYAGCMDKNYPTARHVISYMVWFFKIFSLHHRGFRMKHIDFLEIITQIFPFIGSEDA